MSDSAFRRASLWEPILAGTLPGLIGGVHLAGLLFFLNPHLPFTGGTAVRAALVYGLGMGLVSLLLHLPYTWRSRRRARRLLPWGVTAVLAATAIGAFIHASRFAFYLPPGMNRRLVKLGVIVIACAVLCFYTALLHSLQRRPYGPGSRLLIGVMVLITAYAAFERREAFDPPRPAAPRATTIEPRQRPTLVVVGIDTATLDAVLPLAEVGNLPFFARLRGQGAYARLRSIRPSERVALWTTLASGTLPYRHGVVGPRRYRAPFANADLRLLPLGIGFARWGTAPSDGAPLAAVPSRRLTLPQILHRLGLRVAVVGWPGESDPAGSYSFLVPEAYFDGASGAKTATIPDDLAERARLFQPDAVPPEGDAMSRLGTDLAAPIRAARRGDLWRTGLCRFLLEQRPSLDALFTVLPGLETASRLHFGGHEAVHFRGAQGDRETRSARTMNAYYETLDRELAAIWALMPEPRLLIVVSTYGVEGRSLASRTIARLTGQPAVSGTTERAPDGLLMMLGEGARQDMVSGAVTLVDFAPTVLYGLGFPVASDMEGVVLTRAFEAGFLARRAVSFVPSYETLSPP